MGINSVSNNVENSIFQAQERAKSAYPLIQESLKDLSFLMRCVREGLLQGPATTLYKEDILKYKGTVYAPLHEHPIGGTSKKLFVAVAVQPSGQVELVAMQKIALWSEEVRNSTSIHPIKALRILGIDAKPRAQYYKAYANELLVVRPLYRGNIAGCAEKEGWPFETKLRAAMQAAWALAQLHQAGYVHGNVKASQFLVSSKGEVYLADLSVAHRASPSSPLMRVTGTPGYFPYFQPYPSQSTDLYALGVMLAHYLGVEDMDVTRLINRLVQTDPALRPCAADVATELLRIRESCYSIL